MEKKIDPATLKRTTKKIDFEEDGVQKEPKVSAGEIGKIIELAFNPTREKIREVTIVDRLQGRLFPQLDMINAGRQYCIEVAEYRQDGEAYKEKYKRPMPVQPNLLEEFLYRTAQWQKSVQGKNLERLTDIALAETEGKAGEDDDYLKPRDGWQE